MPRPRMRYEDYEQDHPPVHRHEQGILRSLAGLILPPLISAAITGAVTGFLIVMATRADVNYLQETVRELKVLVTKVADSTANIDNRLNRVEVITEEERRARRKRGYE